MKEKTIYDELSEERKKLQEDGLLPEWFSTPGWQILKAKYLTKTERNLKDIHKRISKHAATYTDNPDYWEPKFFDILWSGHLSASTPVLSNMGTGRGCPVSCSGNYVGDSIYDFYNSQTENAMLSKNGFGISSYLGDIRERGADISVGGYASGVLPVLQDFVQLSRDVSQGCYDTKTELLTENGWEFFENLKEDVKVAQVNDDGNIEFVHFTDYIKYKHTGEMINFKDSKNIDLLVTPNHNMVFKRRRRIDNRRDENGKFLNNKKEIVNEIFIEEASKVPLHRDVYMMHSGIIDNSNSNLSNDDILEIAYQADGSTNSKTKNSYTYVFNFSKTRKIDRLEKILTECDVQYKKSFYGKNTSFTIKPNKKLHKNFKDWIDLKNVSHSWCIEFLQEIAKWDGHKRTDNCSTYCSTNKDNVDFVQSITALVGFKSKIKEILRDGRKPLYFITYAAGDLFGTENLTKTTIDYDDYVYCVTVPSHKLIVRRGGHTLVCGNSQRRGAWAGYVPIEHPDFWEIVTFLHNNPDDCNIGWNISNKFIERLDNGDEDAIDRYQSAMKTKMITGKGYFFFVDKVNELSPIMYKDLGLLVKASNLCCEISLFSDNEHTFTCVLSSMNLYKYDEWKDTDAVFTATVFLDCVAQDFIEIGKKTRGLEKAVRFTEKSRALGLGALGLHSYFQKNMIPFDSFDAHMKNNEMFKHLHDESKRASKWMAEKWGEPEWCKGYGVRNTHTMSVAPNTSSALICGGLSQGIEPVYKNIFVQGSASGEINRINPILLKFMKDRGVYNAKTIKAIKEDQGSVLGVDWLSDDEKEVFKTAFEIDQMAIIRMAAARQKYIDQGQSLNLFFAADESEEYISEVHQEAFKNPYIKGLYYIRSEAGVQAAKGECTACEG